MIRPTMTAPPTTKQPAAIVIADLGGAAPCPEPDGLGWGCVDGVGGVGCALAAGAGVGAALARGGVGNGVGDGALAEAFVAAEARGVSDAAGGVVTK